MNETPAKIPGLPASWLADMSETVRRELGGVEILLIPLRDGSGAVAISPMQKDKIDNARIIDKSGATRCTLEIPNEFKDGNGFYSALYYAEELTAVFIARSGRDFAFVIDEKSGRVLRTYETR